MGRLCCCVCSARHCEAVLLLAASCGRECGAPVPGQEVLTGYKHIITWCGCGCVCICACGVCQILNFSIAYGKTAHGLSKDWGVPLAEAEETVKRWYADR